MKIIINNLGPLQHANFSLGDLTIICGKNNTGKTYATYAFYGFLDFLRHGFEFPVPREIITTLENEGTVSIGLEEYVKDAQQYIDTASSIYSKSLSKIFEGNEKFFEKTSFKVMLDPNINITQADITMSLGSLEKTIIEIRKPKDSETITITLVIDKLKDGLPPRPLVERVVGESIRAALFNISIPNVFISSAERTGSAIFQKELDFTRNRLIELLGDKTAKIHPIQLLGKFSGEYPLAVKRNVDFIREIPNIINRESYILKEHPKILESFRQIIGGEYKVTKDSEIRFIPTSNKRIKLSLVESSSAVRSLLDIGFYLRHIAAKGDLLMIDEPELNLHPENQRRVARLFAQLINAGIKIFITTHSDYIIKELNTLIMLNKDSKRIRTIANAEGYKQQELLNSNSIKVYIAKEDLVKKEGQQRKSKCQTLVAAPIDSTYGIQAESFDETINMMNRIQDDIIWSEQL